LLHLECLTMRMDEEAILFKRASGRYYTGEIVGRRLASEVAQALHTASPKARKISAADPFGGDGRLIVWLMDAWAELNLPKVQWAVTLWDVNDVGFYEAEARLNEASGRNKQSLRINLHVGDAFSKALEAREQFDVVITNPPWELLKPDSRELEVLGATSRKQYIAKMRSYDDWLSGHFPLSQPRRKFAGWGTNLSRVGMEAALAITKEGGIIGVVLPASFLADDQTARLREHLLTEHKVLSASYYPAEAKLYESADTASVAMALMAGGPPAQSLTIATHSLVTGELESSVIALEMEALSKVGFVLPISFGSKALAIINELAQRFPSWRDLETSMANGLWAGRELDETRISEFLQSATHSEPLFIKGRMIGRYATLEHPQLAVRKPHWTPPSSTQARRIAWRDVSRPSQKRRMIATLLDGGYVAGNSLGVAYFKDLAETPLLALLGIMNSTCFEFQLRAHLATGHVSLSSLRKVAVPSGQQLREANALASLVKTALEASDSDAIRVDAYVARCIYAITEDEYQIILDGFDTMSPELRHVHITCYRAFTTEPLPHPAASSDIFNNSMTYAL
jgi:Alw26I/Eco31I/Esp3I family type II restriction m6 adenine DNA methyltransferase